MSATILLLHGAFLCGRTMAPLASSLRAASGLRVETPDLLGHGLEAAADRVDLGAQAARLWQSHGDERPILVGFGLGGRVAMRGLADWPIKPAGLVLIGTGLGPATGRDTIAGRLGRGPTPSPNPGFLEEMFTGWFESPSSRKVRGLAQVAGKMTQGAFERVRATTGSPTFGAHLPKPTYPPTLVIQADGDSNRSLCEAQALVERFDGRLEVFRGAGHALPIERPAEVATRIADWLAKAGLDLALGVD